MFYCLNCPVFPLYFSHITAFLVGSHFSFSCLLQLQSPISLLVGLSLNRCFCHHLLYLFIFFSLHKCLLSQVLLQIIHAKLLWHRAISWLFTLPFSVAPYSIFLNQRRVPLFSQLQLMRPSFKGVTYSRMSSYIGSDLHVGWSNQTCQSQ